MTEKLGTNKVNNNGTVCLPPKVLEALNIEKGKDVVGFKKADTDETVKITTTEVDY